MITPGGGLLTIRYATKKLRFANIAAHLGRLQVQTRVDALANAVKSRWNIGENDVGQRSQIS